MAAKKPPFTRQIIPITKQAFTLGGSALTFNIPRESLIDRLDLYIEGNLTTGAATAAVEGLAAFAKSVTLAGSMAGGRVEPISGIPGPALFEFAQPHWGSLPHSFGALGSTGRFRVTIPLFFRNFGFSSQAKNLLTAIPAHQMSELTLTVQPAAQADVDVNATPTLALATGKIGVEVNQFFRETVPDDLVTIRSTIERTLDNNPATESSHEVKLPSGGDYDTLMLRAFSAANTKMANTAITGPITQPDGAIRLYELSRTTKHDTDFARLRAQNLAISLDSLVDGNAAFNFGRYGEDQLFQTGAIGAALNNVLVQYDSTQISGGKVDFVYRRIFDPNNYLGIVRGGGA